MKKNREKRDEEGMFSKQERKEGGHQGGKWKGKEARKQKNQNEISAQPREHILIRGCLKKRGGGSEWSVGAAHNYFQQSFHKQWRCVEENFLEEAKKKLREPLPLSFHQQTGAYHDNNKSTLAPQRKKTRTVSTVP